MSHRDSPQRKQEKAREIARHLLRLRGMSGVLLLEAGNLWLLTQPPLRPANPAALAETLLGDSLPVRGVLAHQLGAVETIPVDAAQVARWAGSLAWLETRHDLDALVREGIRPLRGYRGTDLRMRLDDRRGLLGRYRSLLPALAATRTLLKKDNSGVEALIGSLPLRPMPST